MNISRGK